jgi:hypothetical protein
LLSTESDEGEGCSDRGGGLGDKGYKNPDTDPSTLRFFLKAVWMEQRVLWRAGVTPPPALKLSMPLPLSTSNKTCGASI